MSFFPFLTPLPSQTELLIYDSEYTGGSPLLCAFTHAISFFWNVTSCPSTFLPSSGQPYASVKVCILVSFLKEAFFDILSPFLPGPVPTSCWIWCLSYMFTSYPVQTSIVAAITVLNYNLSLAYHPFRPVVLSMGAESPRGHLPMSGDIFGCYIHGATTGV